MPNENSNGKRTSGFRENLRGYRTESDKRSDKAEIEKFEEELLTPHNSFFVMSKADRTYYDLEKNASAQFADSELPGGAKERD